MIKLTNTRLLILLCFIASLATLSSCDRDKDETSGKIELLSFGPTGTEHGDTLRFFGRNLNKVTAVQFTGPNVVVNQSEFKQQTSELILLIVPAAAEKGFVTLKTPEGDIVTKTQLNLGVTINVASITPQVKPGENVTITGNFLNWVSQVTFSKDKVVTNFVSQSINQLVVKVPDDAQTGPLILKYQGTDSSELETTDTLKVTLPVTTSFSPNPVKHGTNLTITGTDLNLVKKVWLPGVTNAVTNFVSQSATQIVVKIDSATVKGKVKLEAASGIQTTSATDLDVVLPSIINMTPNPIDPQTNLTITGTNLDVVSGISFTGVAQTVKTFVSQSPTQLIVQVPAGTLRGRITLNVLNSKSMVQSSQELVINGSTVAPVVVYDNALNSGWQKWGGWGTAVQDLANTEQPASGSNAIKITYSDSYGGFQLHPATNFPFPGGYTKLKISIYGGNNATATSRVAIYMKDATDPTDAQSKILTLVPGVYTTYEIPLSDFSNNPAKINEFVIKNYGTANITIYVDDIIFL